MTERNILLLKSAISAAKSMSPLKNKYEEAFQEIRDKYDEMNPLPDENNAGAISMQVSKPMKSYFLLDSAVASD